MTDFRCVGSINFIFSAEVKWLFVLKVNSAKRFLSGLVFAAISAAASAQGTDTEQVSDTEEAGYSDMEVMMVTATRQPNSQLDIPFSTAVIDRETIELTGANRLEDAFRSVPGLQMGTQGNAYFRIATRGLRDTSDVLVMVDGVPFQQLNGSADLTMLPVKSIERIEFVKGPGSTTYGRGAVGGVIQIFTQPDSITETEAEINLSSGSYGYLEVGSRVAIPSSDGVFYAQAYKSTNDGFQDRTGRDAHSASVSYHHNPTDDFSIGINLGHSYVEAMRGSIIPLIDGEPAYGISIEDNYGIPGAKFEGEYNSVSVPLTWVAGDWTISNIANYNEYDRYATGGITIIPGPSASSKGWWENETSQWLLMNDLNASRDYSLGGTTLNFQVGLNYQYGELESEAPSFSGAETYIAPDFDTPVSNIGNGPKGIMSSTIREDGADQLFWGAYTGLEVHAGQLGVYAGLRFDDFEQNLERSTTDVDVRQTGSETTMRLGANYTFYETGETTVVGFANYAEGFRPQFPAFSTSGGVTLPRLLRPEFTESSEAGLKFSAMEGRLSGQGSVFLMEKVDAQRSYRIDSETFLFTNASQRIEGFEGSMDFQVSSQLSGYLTYAYHDAVNTEFVTSTADYSGNTIRMSPDHYVGVGVNLSHGEMNYNLSANYVGERPLRDNLEDTSLIQILPSYTIVNASVRWANDDYFLQLSATNLLDEFYIADDFSSRDAGNAGQPRTIVLSSGISF